MADILDEKIILEGHECKEGHCPICDGDKLDYHSYEVIDGVVMYAWDCGTCGAEGKEVGVVQFDGHDVDRDSIPAQVDALYWDGELRPEMAAKGERGDAAMPDTQFPMKLEPGKFHIFQLKSDEAHDFFKEIGYDYYDREGKQCVIDDYALVHTGSLGSVREPAEYYDKVVIEFGGNLPPDYAGRPVSRGDIIVITPGDEAHAYFCEGVGDFWKVDYFLEQIASNITLPDIDDTIHIDQTEDDRVRDRPIEESPLGICIGVAKSRLVDLPRKSEWLGLPTTMAVLSETLERVGATGNLRWAWEASAFDNDPGRLSWKALSDVVTKVDAQNIDEVNYFAALVENLDTAQCSKLQCLIEIGIHIEDTADVINLIHNLDHYEFLPGITTPLKYAQYLGDGDAEWAMRYSDLLDTPESATARVISGGQFTSSGFVRYPLKRFEEVYDGKNVPEQYRVSETPEKPKAKTKPPQSHNHDTR